MRRIKRRTLEAREVAGKDATSEAPYTNATKSLVVSTKHNKVAAEIGMGGVDEAEGLQAWMQTRLEHREIVVYVQIGRAWAMLKFDMHTPRDEVRLGCTENSSRRTAIPTLSGVDSEGSDWQLPPESEDQPDLSTDTEDESSDLEIVDDEEEADGSGNEHGDYITEEEATQYATITLGEEIVLKDINYATSSRQLNVMEFEDELVVLLRLGGVLLLHSIAATEPEEGPEGAASREPLRYRAPVAYERQNWALGEAGWGTVNV
ncbi:hypothetical protein BGX38DRAFT_1332043 [Terfezia claveryi]|nr:hypothetical protein BGX38DRAFT_1332043 [Terfezia claveryi]